MLVSLANHHSGNGNGATDENGATRVEEEETEQIMRHERSAAALLCKLKPMKSHHATQALNLTLTQDVLGIVGVVASLGRVDNDDLSRLHSYHPLLSLDIEQLRRDFGFIDNISLDLYCHWVASLFSTNLFVN